MNCEIRLSSAFIPDTPGLEIIEIIITVSDERTDSNVGEFEANRKKELENIVQYGDSVWVYDVLGRKVATLVNENLSVGMQASGLYFVRMVAGEFTQTRKMFMLK